jgi:hypothetical protein
MKKNGNDILRLLITQRDFFVLKAYFDILGMYHCDAALALDQLLILPFLQQGVRFDPDLPQTIRLEFAKSNTKVSKPKPVVSPQTISPPQLVHPLTGQLLWAAGVYNSANVEKYEALSPAFINGHDLWPHHLSMMGAEQLQQLQQQALLQHPALQHQLPVRSFL